MIYLIGSLRNPVVPDIAQRLRMAGIEVFDDWHAAPEDADDYWQAYEQARGRTYTEALRGAHATNVFQFDRRHLDASSAGVLVMPAGKSAHMEIGYLMGQGKPGYALLDKEPERWDVMYRFLSGVFYDVDHLVRTLSFLHRTTDTRRIEPTTEGPSRG